MNIFHGKLNNLPPLILAMLILSVSCATLFPKSKSTIESPWDTFEQTKSSFDQIIPFKTTKDDLSELNFSPYKTPNIKILSYLDIINRFMPNASFTKEDIDIEVLNCIKVKSSCQAYEITLEKIYNERYGNIFFDLFKFKRQNRKTGWKFEALIILNSNTVIYKIWRGQPKINEESYQKNPLGPFQEPAGLASDAAIFTTF